MHKLGVFFVLLGLVLSIVGVAVGFWLMLTRGIGTFWMALVPVGFVSLVAGVTLTQLYRE